MKFSKLLVSSALSLSLAFGTVSVYPAFAVEFADTSGIQSESSINKLVSLGVFPNPGEAFNPDDDFTRYDFAIVANQIMSLKAGAKQVKFSDVGSKDKNYVSVLKMVNEGYLKPNKNSFGKNQGVTYAEFARLLAHGLGLKKQWTNRPVDFLFYLDRKGVLDIDTDLDAVVTREAAAVAVDRFITLVGTFESDSGIVAELYDGGFVYNNGSENVKVKFAKNVSVFVSGQSSANDAIVVGSPVEVVFNKKGEVAYAAGQLLDAEEGALKLTAGKWNIGTFVKDVNMDVVMMSLPNSPADPFTLTLFNSYQTAGAEFFGQAFFTENDEVTLVYPYIKKATANKDVTVTATSITVAFSAALKQTFVVAEGAKVTLDGKDTTLAALVELAGKGTNFSGNFEAGENGQATSVTLVTKK